MDMAEPAPRLPMGVIPNRPGRWMRRVWYRVGEVQAASGAGSAERQAAADALAALEANPDSRDRHRDAVQRLARAGELERALEVAEAWVARDRLDADALTAKADLLGRVGRRDEALRTLTGTVDLAPNSEALHLRLARAFERAGRVERACAHRVALAELDEDDAEAVAAAVRCERALGHRDAAERWTDAASRSSDARLRANLDRALASSAPARPFGGELTIDADWDEAVDLDVSIVNAQGTRLSWMGGRTSVEGEDASAAGRERLGLRSAPTGTYYVEVNRTGQEDMRPVRGELRIRVLGQSRTVAFVLRGAHATVARVRVTRESRLE
jgi:tetratricopeptide (TPR) repeat protein